MRENGPTAGDKQRALQHYSDLALQAAAPKLLAALKLAEDVLSRTPYSANIWFTEAGEMHPMRGITIIREAIAAAEVK